MSATKKGKAAHARSQVTARRVAAELAKDTAGLMLDQFQSRPPVKGQGKAYHAAVETLTKAMGTTASREDVAWALCALDDGMGKYLTEMIDEAWHTAWATATEIARGRS